MCAPDFVALAPEALGAFMRLGPFKTLYLLLLYFIRLIWYAPLELVVLMHDIFDLLNLSVIILGCY